MAGIEHCARSWLLREPENESYRNKNMGGSIEEHWGGGGGGGGALGEHRGSIGGTWGGGEH